MVCPWPVMFAGRRPRESPRRGTALYGDEAPPCMRWRGLALPRSPGCRSLSCSCRSLSCDELRDVPPVLGSRRLRQSPGPSSGPVVSLGADPVFSGERFLLPTHCAAQDLSARTSRFFSHPQDICCLSSVHGRFPLRRAQVYPQDLGITGGCVNDTPGIREGAARASRPERLPAAHAEGVQKVAGQAGGGQAR